MTYNPVFSTLAVNYNNGYIDKKFYRSAVDQNNLKYMDYFQSRVMHNPQYSESMFSDYLDLIYPKMNNGCTSLLEDNIDSLSCNLTQSSNETMTVTSMSMSLSCSSIKRVSQEEKVSLDALVKTFLEKIKDYPDRDPLTYMLCSYLNWANVQCDIEELKPYFEDINKEIINTYNDLYKKVNLSTWKGGRLKIKFIEIFQEILNLE